MKWNRWLLPVLTIFVAQAVAWAVTGDSLYGWTFLAFGALVWAIGAVSEAHRLSSAGQRWTAISFFVMFLLFGSSTASMIGNAYWMWGFLVAAAVGGVTLALLLHLRRPRSEESQELFKEAKESSMGSPRTFFLWFLTSGLFILVVFPILSTISLPELEKRNVIIPTVAFLGWVLLLFLVNNIIDIVALIRWLRAKARSKD